MNHHANSSTEEFRPVLLAALEIMHIKYHGVIDINYCEGEIQIQHSKYVPIINVVCKENLMQMEV